ncbi:response regulator [Oxynema sp. CENA135]|uniref:response regulator n=1 Tax=Oxynema sp. CENA135 TaxID=984206 RepID=UPI00190B13A7|nr:response regulator [Oxynema sp. CENA135]MBK4731337.1 response regulator [Oxynema sp. CENA135]
MIDFLDEGKTVFLIDDDTALLELFCEVLSDYGYQVRTATNGQFALRSIRQTVPDLVILDLTLPGMNGVEIYKELQRDESTRKIPVIFMSGVDPNTESDFTIFNDCDYLLKPVDCHRLFHHINRAFKKEAFGKKKV